MKKSILVIMLFVMCFSVISVQAQEKTLEQEIQKLNKCCAHKNALVQTELDTLNTYKIQEEISFIWGIVNDSNTKERMVFLNRIVKSTGVSVYWQEPTLFVIYLGDGYQQWIYFEDENQEYHIKYYIKKADKGALQILKTLQSLDRKKFVQELRQKLCK